MSSVAVPDAPGLKEIVAGRDRDDIGGFFTIEVIRDGPRGPEVIERRKNHNLVVNSGKRQLWRLAQGTQTNLFDQFRIGTCGVAPNSGQTNVVSPVTGTLVTADSLTLLAGTRTAEFVVSYPSGVGSKSAANIQEVVILNQNTSPGGSAAARATFTPVSKSESDKILIRWQVRVS